MISARQLDLISGHQNHAERKRDFAGFLSKTAARMYPPIARPHDMAQFLAQIMHESAGLRYTREIWGPTTAQKRYEGRRDLGNTQPGDGKRFMGRDFIQITGRSNYRALTRWAQNAFTGAPDFEANPDALARPEWLGLGALWYWANRVPKPYVDAGDIEMVTRRVNGGLNGYADRLRYYDRAALVLLGRDPKDVRGFQAKSGLTVDGISGPKTRAALHRALVALPVLGALPKPPTPRSSYKGFWGWLVGWLAGKGKQ